MFDQIGETYLGFTVTRIRESEELSGRLVEFTYDKTGTQLCWVDNGALNKLFSVSFKTLPETSTGVFHILEHSVLCGSAKYPVREPFVELLKSSMQTFLNAMTFSDKTMYPVSSRNTEDFMGLTEVYLDAVFAPTVLKDPNIFYQEGWHIEQDADGTLSYKGVVFNEMKGAMSSVDDLTEYEMMSLLFPDNTYGCNSGGDPAVIPSLTHEEFVRIYQRFYHPSNARIFLDGDIPLTRVLTLIAEYLSKYDRLEALPEITDQIPKSAEKTCTYELSKDEPLENKTILCLGKIMGTWRDRVKMLAARVVKDVLAGSNEAPLKRAVLSEGLCQEMQITLDDGIAQPYLTVQFKNITDGKEPEILPLIRKTTADLLADGLPREALEASVNRLEFQLLEPAEPQGLERAINCMDSWLYGGDPMDHIVYSADFKALRAMLDDGSYDAIAREMFLDETGLCILHMQPSYTRGEELRQDEAARLAAIKESWTEADFAENTRMNAALQAWQQTPDTEEQLATLPMLSLDAVSEEMSWTDTEVSETDGVTVLFHPAACPGILHIALYFKLTDFSLEDLTAAALGAPLFTKLATANYSGLELMQALKSHVGRLSVSLEQYARIDRREETTPMLAVHCSVLREKLPAAIELIQEVLFTTRFTEKEKIREILIQRDERCKQIPVMAGHVLGLDCVMSRYAARGAVSSATNGYEAMKYVHAFVQDFDAKYEEFCALMARVQQSLTKQRLVASVTSNVPCNLSPLLAIFGDGESVPETASYSHSQPERTGYVIPAQIGFAVQGWHLGEAGKAYKPEMTVAAKLITFSYLWNVVRVQGGAYGTGFSVGKDGAVYTYSYRDPTPLASLEANKAISAFIRSFCESGEPLDGYIISTLSDDDPLRSPLEAGLAADMSWLSGRTREERLSERRGMMAATKDSLLALCDMLDQFAAEGPVCVVASEAQLADCKDLTILE